MPVFAERYHTRALTTPREVRNALCYVILNSNHHAHELGRRPPGFDPLSSAASFDGWTPGCCPPWPPEPLSVPAKTWMLTKGWRDWGQPCSERPGH